MVNFALVAAGIPLLFRLAPYVVPAGYLEPYAYWSSQQLNSDVDGRVPRWRNMGFWEAGRTDFTAANEALAKRLIEFSGSSGTGNVLDVAHGSGESLLLHLDRNPAHLDALTSIPHESIHAQELVQAHGAGNTAVQWFTSTASYLPGKGGLEHPLNPMRGFMGEQSRQSVDPYGDDDDVAHGDSANTSPSDSSAGAPPPYDLVYILDAIYHFPPTVEHYLASVLKVLRPGEGVIAFTDIVPPADLSPILGGTLLPWVLSVPPKNLFRRPTNADEYRTFVEKVGYENVKVEDWSENVFPGLAKNLAQRGGLWKYVAQGIEAAHRKGWKFYAVRAQRPVVEEIH